MARCAASRVACARFVPHATPPRSSFDIRPALPLSLLTLESMCRGVEAHTHTFASSCAHGFLRVSSLLVHGFSSAARCMHLNASLLMHLPRR
eukprot:5756174-Pleurochrysis_carterae.AAC.4